MGEAMRPEKARQLLKISPTADKDTIKRAYRRLAGRHHPDKFERAPQPEKDQAAAMMQNLNSAYEVLTEPPMDCPEPREAEASGFFSVLQRVQEESGRGPVQPKPREPRPPLWPKLQPQPAMSEIMAREERKARGETGEYLEIFHQYHNDRSMDPRYDGYLKLAQRVRAAPGTKPKKLMVLQDAFQELPRNRRHPIAAVHLVESLCAAGQKDNALSFHKIACAIAAFAPYQLNDERGMTAVYRNFSGLDHRALTLRKRFGIYLQKLGVTLADPFRILTAIDETTRITLLESALKITGLGQFIDRRNPLTSYLRTLRIVIGDPKAAKVALSVAKVFFNLSEDQTQQIVRRAFECEGDVVAVKKILRELYWRPLLRSFSPVAAYDIAEDLYRATVPKGVTPEIVTRAFNIMTDNAYVPDLASSVDATVFFVDAMLRAGAEHDASVKGFRHFRARSTMDQDSVKDTPLRASYDKIFQEETYGEGMQELINAFFS